MIPQWLGQPFSNVEVPEKKKNAVFRVCAIFRLVSKYLQEVQIFRGGTAIIYSSMTSRHLPDFNPGRCLIMFNS